MFKCFTIFEIQDGTTNDSKARYETIGKIHACVDAENEREETGRVTAVEAVSVCLYVSVSDILKPDHVESCQGCIPPRSRRVQEMPCGILFGIKPTG